MHRGITHRRRQWWMRHVPRRFNDYTEPIAGAFCARFASDRLRWKACGEQVMQCWELVYARRARASRRAPEAGQRGVARTRAQTSRMCNGRSEKMENCDSVKPSMSDRSSSSDSNPSSSSEGCEGCFGGRRGSRGKPDSAAPQIWRDRKEDTASCLTCDGYVSAVCIRLVRAPWKKKDNVN